MDISRDFSVPGIPVPCELYENYVCVALSELAETSRMSISEVRAHILRDTASGVAYLSLFHRISDGVEMVAGYIFS